MAETDHIDEDEVLRRMLNTPPKEHKDSKKGALSKAPQRAEAEEQK